MATVDRRLRPRIVATVKIERGGYRVTFQGCEHSVLLKERPSTLRMHCSACIEEAVADMRAGQNIALLSPREFQVSYAVRLERMERDADQETARVFRRQYAMTPQEARDRLRRLRAAAHDNVIEADDDVAETMQLLLLLWYPVRPE